MLDSTLTFSPTPSSVPGPSGRLTRSSDTPVSNAHPAFEHIVIANARAPEKALCLPGLHRLETGFFFFAFIFFVPSLESNSSFGFS